MRIPFKMKGNPMKRNFRIGDDSETIVDVEKTTGEQIGEKQTGGVKTFPSVQRLKDFNAPKHIIDAEYNKQMELYKQKHKLT